jgi:hypothetical protein
VNDKYAYSLGKSLRIAVMVRGRVKHRMSLDILMKLDEYTRMRLQLGGFGR